MESWKSLNKILENRIKAKELLRILANADNQSVNIRDCAKKINVKRNTIYSYIDDYKELINVESKQQGLRGRPRTFLSLNKEVNPEIISNLKALEPSVFDK